MQLNDIIMFIDKGTYSKWFFGKIGRILQCTRATKEGRTELYPTDHVRVEWLEPVEYFGKFTKVSDFPLTYFQNSG